MKSITIHGLDDHVAGLIAERANAAGSSLNKTIKRLLEEALGVRPTTTNRHAADFEEFLGCWSARDREEFEDRVADFERVEAEDWER